MEIVVVTAVGNTLTDVLTVTGLVTEDPTEETPEPEAKEVTATGWVSAVVNYFPPEAYDSDGNRDPDVPPRTMTKAEITAYATNLIREAALAATPPPPTEVSFL